jgi:hypothetical protein
VRVRTSAVVPWSRILRVLFVVYVVTTVIHIGWVVAHEPFSFDAWNVANDTHAQPFTFGRFLDYWTFEYAHSNPRIGQGLTYLAYKLEWFAVIATPLAYLATTLAVFVLGTKRWPSWSRGRDLALLSIILGSIWFAFPQVGKTLFCRAYCANYVYGMVIQLWFLVPLRLRGDQPASRAACAAYAVFGVIAGMCNEHTGPTLCAFLVGYAWWTQRRSDQRPWFAWAGAAGAIVGFAAIFFAPGQTERYEGLAQKASLVGRVIARGITNNLDILRDLMLAAAPLLGLLVIVGLVTLRRDHSEDTRATIRASLRLVAIAMIASTAIAVTMFASPKLGPRFYYAGMAVLLAAFVGVIDAAFATRRLIGLVVLAVAASGYAAWHTIPLYAAAKHQSDDRIAALEAARPGTVFLATSFDQVEESWWFLGDDFRDTRKRELVASYFDLAGVVLRSYDRDAPLGVVGARFVGHGQFTPASCTDDHGGFAIGANRGFDIAALHAEVHVGIALLRQRLAAGVRLDQLDIGVELDDAAPKFPRKRVLVGRWWPDRYEGWAGRIDREGGNTRVLVVPKELPRDMEMFAYLVGGESRRIGTATDRLRYVPWQSGIYWLLACRTDECFVVAASRHGA